MGGTLLVLFSRGGKKRFPETCATTRDQGVCSGLSGDLRKARSNPKPVEIPYIPENSSISFPMLSQVVGTVYRNVCERIIKIKTLQM